MILCIADHNNENDINITIRIGGHINNDFRYILMIFA